MYLYIILEKKFLMLQLPKDIKSHKFIRYVFPLKNLNEKNKLHMYGERVKFRFLRKYYLKS